MTDQENLKKEFVLTETQKEILKYSPADLVKNLMEDGIAEIEAKEIVENELGMSIKEFEKQKSIKEAQKQAELARAEFNKKIALMLGFQMVLTPITIPTENKEDKKTIKNFIGTWGCPPPFQRFQPNPTQPLLFVPDFFKIIQDAVNFLGAYGGKEIFDKNTLLSLEEMNINLETMKKIQKGEIELKEGDPLPDNLIKKENN